MIASSILAATGAGMLSTFTPESNHSLWIGYQCLTGIGIGLGMQQVGSPSTLTQEPPLLTNKPLIAVQTVLDISQVPVGTSVIIFVQT